MKISVVTPSFNQGDYIGQTIASILTQAGNFEIEYIIADGGSSDQTVAVIKQYEEQLQTGTFPLACQGVHLTWWSKPDSGQPAAVNEGFKLASGDILAWIGSDDIYSSGAFAHAIKIFTEHPGLDLLYGNVYFKNETNNTLTRQETGPVDLDGITTRRQQIFQPGTFFSRRIIQKVGGLDEHLQYVHDYELFIRILKTGKAFFTPFIMATFRIWARSKSGSQRKKFTEEQKIVHQRYHLCVVDGKQIRWITELCMFTWLRHHTPNLYAWLKKTFYRLNSHWHY